MTQAAPEQTIGHTRANKTDAGNGSKAICRVSNVLPPPAGGALRVVFDKLCHAVPLTLAVA
jgi:hypothetical protein